MDLLQLQYFKAIAEYENMTKAAQALYVSQPNLSTSMSRLEDDLNVKLFDRRRGKISLTEDGKLFLSHVVAALNELNIGVEELHSGSRSRLNCIRVASGMPDIMNVVLSQGYSEDRQDPISIKQVNCPNRHVLDLVASETVDFGLYFGEVDNSFLESNLMGQCERVVLLRKDHPLAGKKYVSLSALSDISLVCNYCRDDEDFMKQIPSLAGFVPDVHFECDNLQLEATIVTSRNAVSICPATSFQRLLFDDPALPVACLRFTDPVPPATLRSVRRRGHLLSAAALQFFAHLSELFDGEHKRTQTLLRNLFP